MKITKIIPDPIYKNLFEIDHKTIIPENIFKEKISTINYREWEFEKVLKEGKTSEYKPSIKIYSEHGETKHLGITWEELKKIKELLTDI